MARRPNPTHYDGDLPQALLDEARVLIADGGLEAFTLRALAREVGVSHAAPGHHFGSRRGLLTRLAIEGFTGLRSTMEDALEELPSSVGSAARLQVSGVAYLRFCKEQPALFTVMFRFGELDQSDPELASAATDALQVLADAAAHVVAEHQVTVPDTEALVLQAWSLVHGLATLWHSGSLASVVPDTSLEDLGWRVTEGFLAAIVPPTSADNQPH